MLVFTIGLPTRFGGRTAHGKGACGHPEHVHRHGGIEIHRAVAHHRYGSVGGGGIPRGIGHGVG